MISIGSVINLFVIVIVSWLNVTGIDPGCCVTLDGIIAACGGFDMVLVFVTTTEGISW